MPSLEHGAWPRRHEEIVLFLLFLLPVIPLRLMQIAYQNKKLNILPSPLKLLISLFPRSVTFY